jgi:hypothetical protein
MIVVGLPHIEIRTTSLVFLAPSCTLPLPCFQRSTIHCCCAIDSCCCTGTSELGLGPAADYSIMCMTGRHKVLCGRVSQIFSRQIKVK